jgi:hypothetical protein
LGGTILRETCQQNACIIHSVSEWTFRFFSSSARRQIKDFNHVIAVIRIVRIGMVETLSILAHRIRCGLKD